MFDPLNLLPRVNNALFGNREGPPGLPNPFGGPDGADADRPGNQTNPGSGDPGLDSLPPGMQGRDSIPYGVAKQLDLPPPPPLPGAPHHPGGPNAPAAPSPPPFGGNGPATPNAAAPPPFGGSAQTIPANPTPPGHSHGSPLGQVFQTVQAVVSAVIGTTATTASTATTTMARGSDPNVPLNPAATRPATANPVAPPATAAAAQPAQTAVMPPTTATQAAAGSSAQPMGTVANPNAANPAAVMPAARAGSAEAAQQPQQSQPPQGRTDAVPAQQRPEGSLLDRLMSLLRPSAPGNAQGSLAPNMASAAQATTAATVVAVPLAVAATQAPMDARGNVLAINDRAAIQRTDGPLTGVYTADGPYRRGLRRGGNVMSAQFSRLLIALGLAGPPVTMRGRDAEYELSMALQWLFWLLAIVAYACLGLAVIAFLPAGSDVFGDSGRGWTTGFAVAGLFAAAAAWWFARQLSTTRDAPDAQDPGRDEPSERRDGE